jgi:hypothetical protein
MHILDFINFLKFSFVKDSLEITRTKTTVEKKIFANNISDKALILRIYVTLCVQ